MPEHSALIPIPEGITREDVVEALNQLDNGNTEGFSDSLAWDLVHEGKRYPPKAAIGIAARRVLGRPMTRTEPRVR